MTLRLRHARHPRRPGAGPAHRGGGPADLPDQHLRAGRRRRAPARATSTAAPATRPATRCRSACAALEGGRRGLAFASGLAAEDTLLRTVCQPGDHVVIPDDAYGGTYRLFARVAERWGLDWTAAHVSRPRRGPGRDPTRPHPDDLGRDADQPAARHRRHRRRWPQLAHEHDALLVVDNTFASPYLQQPLGARRRRGRALHHQVPRRALRRGRWRAGRRRRRARRGARASTRTRWARSTARSTPG